MSEANIFLNINCNQCDQFFADNQDLKRHVNAKHILKMCTECDFTSMSICNMKTHKKTQHEHDNFEEESAFNKLLYNQTWKVRGFKDPISTLEAYRTKIQNAIKN